jgi:hypothetical protein
MRSDMKQINSVRVDFLQQKNQIACRHSHDTVVGGKGRTVLDDSGTLAITAWTCAKCGGVIEEIRIIVQDGKAQPRPMRYGVAPPRSVGRPAPVAHRAPRN